MRSYHIPVKRTVVETASIYIRANDKGIAVALALAEANNPTTQWLRKQADISPISLDTRAPTEEGEYNV